MNYRVWVEHSAFDRMLGVCEVKSGLQHGEATALSCSQSDVNNRCHKNVIVASHYGPTLTAVGCGGWDLLPEQTGESSGTFACNRMLDHAHRTGVRQSI